VALILVAAAVTSASRGAVIGLLAYIPMWLWFCYRKRILHHPGALLLVAAAVVGTYYLYNFTLHDTQVGERIETTNWHGLVDETRAKLYARGVELFLAHPVIGIGFGQYQELSGTRMYSHSDYVEVACSTGIVGFIMYFSIFWVLWRRIARLGRLTSDPHVAYALGVFKAMLLLTLLLSIVYPKMLSPEHWYWLAPVIGYTYGLSLDFRERAAAKGAAKELALSRLHRLRSA
jgi:O-antigen ligase